MERDQFDRLSRLVAGAATRREALRLLVSGVLVGTVTWVEGADARRRRARHRGTAQAQLQSPQPLCPSTCNQNCSSKRLQGGANLTKCDFNARDLDGVQLNGANLSQACFGGARARQANFRGANLSKTCLCGADLRGADFRGSNVTPQQLACATVGCTTILPNGKPAVTCGNNETCCDGTCTNTQTDPLNCGSCGTHCQVYQACQAGRCLCTDAGETCNGDPNWSCCGPDSPRFTCSCTLTESGEFTILETCEDGPCEPPGIPCVGPLCSACCPPGSTCDPVTGTCFR